MKQSEIITDRLIAIAAEIRADKRNARNAKLEADVLIGASEVAFKESRHMLMQKRKPRVKFFDAHVKLELTAEQKVSAAAKLLSKSRKK